MAKRAFKIYRYDPDTDSKPYMQTIEVELDGSERMLLDALMKLKALDPSISFRRSCREGVCGSDAMNINGKNGLACLTNMRTLPGVITLKPLPAAKAVAHTRLMTMATALLTPTAATTPNGTSTRCGTARATS